MFDAKIQYQNPAVAFLTYDDEHHRMAFANLSVLRPEVIEMDRKGVIGVDHIAYSYASVTDLLEGYAQLKEQRILPYWCIHHGITVSMYYADPDSNQMEFQVCCFSDSRQANEYMCEPHIEANPIRVEFDPEEWLARLRAGAPASGFLVRRSGLPISPIRGSGDQA